MNQTEEKVLKLIAQDRIESPLSSMYQKLKKAKKEHAHGLAGLVKSSPEQEFEGERVFAYYETEDKSRARGMKEAVAEFAKEFPKYGAILQGKIQEKRVLSEEHLYFGTQFGSRLTADDYIGVMHSLGLTEQTARTLYPELVNVSKSLAKKREENRSIIVGKYADSE